MCGCVLGHTNRGLLISQGVNLEASGRIQKTAQADVAVELTKRPLSMYFGPHEVLLVLNVQFTNGLSASEVTAAIDRIERTIRQQYPDITRIYIEAEALPSCYLEEQAFLT